MIELLILAVFIYLFLVFSPKIEYIRQSKMWICWYNKGKRSRDWFIIYRE